MPISRSVHKENESEKWSVVVDNSGWPQCSSPYISGIIGGHKLKLLIDTGSTTSLLSERFIKKLPIKLRSRIIQKPTEGFLAGGERMQLSGSLDTEVKIHTLKLKETFAIAPMIEDGILGIPFLENHGCDLVFGSTPELVIRGYTCRCTDHTGRTVMSELASGTWGLVNT